MSKKADNFFNDINFVSIVDTIKNVYMSDGAMSTVLDFERVLDEADLYAFKNWLLGELVQGPDVGRYSVTCTFMWPYKLMPDPNGAKRLIGVGCKVKFIKTTIKVPIEIENYEDFVPGTRYPKMMDKKVWLVQIEIPLDLMDDIKEGSIDLADQTIDLEDLDEAYSEDLDKQGAQEEGEETSDMAPDADMGMAPPAATGGPAQ